MPEDSFFFSNTMLEEILHIRNVKHAVDRVISNGGASGIDGMQIDNLRDYLNTNWKTLRTDILSGTYLPHAVRKVEIPKASGGKRTLGIPTAIDRGIPHSISHWLGLKSDGAILTRTATASVRIVMLIRPSVKRKSI